MRPTRVSINAGESLSQIFQVPARVVLRGLWLPAEWTAAPASIRASISKDVWAIMRDKTGAEIEYTIPGGSANPHLILFDTGQVFGGWYVQVCSGVLGTEVPQTVAVDCFLVWGL
jgi:hypothetical protein